MLQWSGSIDIDINCHCNSLIVNVAGIQLPEISPSPQSLLPGFSAFLKWRETRENLLILVSMIISRWTLRALVQKAKKELLTQKTLVGANNDNRAGHVDLVAQIRYKGCPNYYLELNHCILNCWNKIYKSCTVCSITFYGSTPQADFKSSKYVTPSIG